MASVHQELTEAMAEGLMSLFANDPVGTPLSNRNAPRFIASNTLSALVERGLAYRNEDHPFGPRGFLTKEGRAMATKMKEPES